MKISNKYNDGSNKDENKDKNKNEEMYDYIEYINTPNDFIFKFTINIIFLREFRVNINAIKAQEIRDIIKITITIIFLIDTSHY